MNRWFDPRGRSAGLWAFILHRGSGIGLVLYLYLHLAALNQLRGGPQRWDEFVGRMRSPLFLALDVILLAGVLIHGLNGLRLTLLGLGRGLGRQKELFWICLALTAVFTMWGAWAIFTQ